MYAPKFSGTEAGLHSKSEQLTSITIQTDPRQRTCGPAPTPWLMRSPEVPNTLPLITRVTVLKRFLKIASPPP